MAYANEDQRKMAAVWRSKAWKERKAQLLKEVPRCEWCNGRSNVINHRRQGYYEGYELCRREEVDIICQPCHKHWTDTGQKRTRIYDNCSVCDAPIWQGSKACFMCGSSIIRLSDVSSEKRAQLLKILGQCPDVYVGDVWTNVWAWPEVKVLKFTPQQLPWPMVDTDQGDVGLPAFKFGKLKERGDGTSWRRELFGEENRPVD